jgi:hypothetical protein
MTTFVTLRTVEWLDSGTTQKMMATNAGSKLHTTEDYDRATNKQTEKE